jgi:RimJ/RimL family protein N-acetyltransferase
VAGFVLTDGVVGLREWQDTDAAWYADSVRDPQIQRYTSESPALTARQVREAIVRLRGSPDDTGYVICAAGTGEACGNIGVHRDGRVGEVSYWLAATGRGRGLACRALRLLSDWAFTGLALTELRLWTHVDNVASRRVAERAGYHRVPDLDRRRTVKGRIWRTVMYARLANPRPAR